MIRYIGYWRGLPNVVVTVDAPTRGKARARLLRAVRDAEYRTATFIECVVHVDQPPTETCADYAWGGAST